MTENNMDWIHECRLCPRECGADRTKKEGACRTGIDDTSGEIKLPLARAALHYWEEPCISGSEGSGAVFFSGCSLGCLFCQNGEISTGRAGKYVPVSRLADIFLELQEQGANNINLVTAGHVLPAVITALERSKAKGLEIPVLYNTSSYEKADSIRLLDGMVDIYLPDMKYMSGIMARSFSLAEDYPEVAKAAIDEMFRQTGPYKLDEKGLIKKGLVIRHLVLPGCTADSKKVLHYLYRRYGDDVLLSIMNQYTPVREIDRYPVLNRRVRASEYDSVIEYALSIGIKRAYMQSNESAMDSFIPAFDYTGI